MVRKNGAWQPEDSPVDAGSVRPALDDARFVDLDTEDDAPFHRAQKRVPVRRGPLPKKTAQRLAYVLLALGVLTVIAVFGAFIYRYGERSWRFRIDSSDQIELAGNHNVTRSQVMEVMGGEIGRNIFFVSLDQRRAQLEQIPWVESAAVMRFVPNRLKIAIRERMPVAFARVGSHIGLIDPGGHIMEMPAHSQQKYSFPVIVGTSDAEPLSTRAVRMKTYQALVADLDSEGARNSQDLSEADLTDPEDAKVLVNDPAGEVLVHLGSARFLDRYKVFKAHAQEWRQQYGKLESVDLRYDRQIVVNPDLTAMPRAASVTPAAAKVALAAGVPAVAIAAAKIAKREQAKAEPPKPLPAKPPAKKASAPIILASKKASIPAKPAPAKATAPTKPAPKIARAPTQAAPEAIAPAKPAPKKPVVAAKAKHRASKRRAPKKSASLPRKPPKKATAAASVKPAAAQKKIDDGPARPHQGSTASGKPRPGTPKTD
jgi:cell division protein FtsQ